MRVYGFEPILIVAGRRTDCVFTGSADVKVHMRIVCECHNGAGIHSCLFIYLCAISVKGTGLKALFYADFRKLG